MVCDTQRFVAKDADKLTEQFAHLPVRCMAQGQMAARHSPVGQQHH